MKTTVSFFTVLGVSFIVTFSFLHIAPHASTVALFEEQKANAQTASIIEAVEEPVLEPVPAFKPEEMTWTSVATAAEWLPRDSAATFVFKDRLWIAGGLNGNGVRTNDDHAVHYWEAQHFNDVWSSADGSEWIEEKNHAAWGPRRSMSIVEFKGALWMMGGWEQKRGYVNDVWRSEDGAAWKQVAETAAWKPREGQIVEVFDGKLWMMGGVNYDQRKVFNDVWYSEDGIEWKKAIGEVPWSGRWDHATAVFKDRIYLVGGMDISKDVFKDVWTTKDGVSWELVTDTPAWDARQGHGLAVADGLLWLVGRLNDDVGGGNNTVWFSADGKEWQKTASDPEWKGREDHGVVVFKDNIYVVGGMDADWKWRNDVWRME